MSGELKKIEEDFFSKVSVDEDLSTIKKRGERNLAHAEEQEKAADLAATTKSLKMDQIQLEEGKDYKLKIDGKEYAFTVEAGGILAG